MFTLAISCFTTSNLPWFTGLTFQAPVRYCCLQHRTLLPSPVIPQLGFVLLWLSLFILSGAISPLFSSSILGTYWPGGSSFSVISFCLFILFMGFSRQECWSDLPFPSPVDQVLSEFYLMWGQETGQFRSGSHGNSCCGAWSVSEIFVPWPWYRAPHLWPWHRTHKICRMSGISSLGATLPAVPCVHQNRPPQSPILFWVLMEASLHCHNWLNH